MKTYNEMEVDARRAELRNLRWKMLGYIAKAALDLVMAVTILYLLLHWYGNLGPCRP